MNTPTLPAPRNPACGFYAAMGTHAAEAWPLAIRTVSRRARISVEASREVLESVIGEVFAQRVLLAMSGGRLLDEAIDLMARG
ncbi:hypothetical protein [Paraburkholderia adhaesiva]|uniref:hypothetical protein n=1 Tax=Paraburkholderia adhaesiva TaxID=2883244 RepID=UPI001F46AB69|nr:hypothetical protein [Paraburkholderia adhaesiva]